MGPRHVTAESVSDAMRMFSAPELLHGKNKWYCPRCRGHVDAVKRIGIWKLPPLLIIHLKRFSYDKCVTGLGLSMLHDILLLFSVRKQTTADRPRNVTVNTAH